MTQERTKRPAAERVLAFSLLFAALIFAIALAGRPAHAATTFTVNSTGDYRDTNSTDNRCRTGFAVIGVGEVCTLRAAIEQANATRGADTIKFNIAGGGVKTIKPASALPEITDSLTIDGYSQPGARPNKKARGNNAVLLVELNGANAGPATALYIGGSNSVVKGLVINRFADSSIIIGGSDNKIEGNFIGTDPSGTTAPGYGFNEMRIFGTNSTIGGTSPAARNLISGNRYGVLFILGATGNEVLGNYIGTDKDGTGNLGNDLSGVRILNGSENTIGGATSGAANIIAFNGAEGVAASNSSSTGNRILSNSIFSNGLLGIDLNQDGRTPNDPGDTDTGPNDLQNFPVITSATTSSSGTAIRARLNSAPGKTFTVQFFSNPSGNEGRAFIGQRKVTTNAKGSVSFSFSPARVVEVGQTITSTATGPGGDTSEFSAPRKVLSG